MDYDYGYDSSGMDMATSLVALSFIFVIVAIVGLISYIVSSLALMFMFKRAGHPRAWAAWVPFYNTYVFLKFGGQKTYWFWIYLVSGFLTLIPFVGPIIAFVGSVMFTIVTVYAIIFINKSFGKETGLVGWTIFGFFLMPIWAFVLAFGDKYNTFYVPARGPVFLGDPNEIPIVW